MKDSAVKRWSGVHAWLFRVSGGRLGRRLVGNDMLLLTTIGRLSGRSHTVPLLYLRDGNSLVIIASYGGRLHHPHWYENLVVEPEVDVQIGRVTERRLARTASSAEHATWWPRIVEAYDGYENYQSRTSRQIPVVFLDPV